MLEDGKIYCNDTLSPFFAELENGKLIMLGCDSVKKGFLTNVKNGKII
jgi:hypothetical protein